MYRAVFPCSPKARRICRMQPFSTPSVTAVSGQASANKASLVTTWPAPPAQRARRRPWAVGHQGVVTPEAACVLIQPKRRKAPGPCHRLLLGAALRLRSESLGWHSAPKKHRKLTLSSRLSRWRAVHSPDNAAVEVAPG